MKKYTKRIFIFICLILVAITLTGCLGSEAESAYDIAVRNGFVGTEQEWLESLKGKDGESLYILDIYNAMKDDGYTGSLSDFLHEYFSDVEINGKSAYEVAVENGYKGTEEEWLASLKGMAGADGEKGDSIDLYATYQQLVKIGEIDCSFLEFVQTYLNVDLNLGNEQAISKGLRSAVSIFALSDSVDNLDDYTTGSVGAGVIYKINKTAGSAYIITNFHVVYNESKNSAFPYLYLFLYGQEKREYIVEASFVGGSATYDIAVLRVENSDVIKESDAIAIDVFNSNEIAVGTTAIAIGNPQSDGISVTEGIVSVDSETIYMTPMREEGVTVDENGDVAMRVLRIDASVNSGNSGGGVYNENGQLIGIVNAKIKSVNAENIAYAIPSNIAVNVAQNIIDNCNGVSVTSPIKCTIGLMVQTISVKSVYNEEKGTVDIVEEIKVAEVSPNSPASGQFMVGDILVSMTLKGVKYDVTRNFVVIDACLNARNGDKATFEVLRNGVLTTVEITFKTGNPVG